MCTGTPYAETDRERLHRKAGEICDKLDKVIAILENKQVPKADWERFWEDFVYISRRLRVAVNEELKYVFKDIYNARS